MKNETAFAATDSTEAKQAWTAPTLTTLSLPLDTLAMGANGMDGGGTAGTTQT
jgi:hypothetical protein